MDEDGFVHDKYISASGMCMLKSMCVYAEANLEDHGTSLMIPKSAHPHACMGTFQLRNYMLDDMHTVAVYAVNHNHSLLWILFIPCFS